MSEESLSEKSSQIIPPGDQTGDKIEVFDDPKDLTPNQSKFKVSGTVVAMTPLKLFQTGKTMFSILLLCGETLLKLNT